MNKLLILILLFSAFVPHAQGAHYFVSATGNDGNNGTSTSTPWKTITKVNNTNFAAGDIISFQGGQSFSGNLVLTESGTAAAPITINSYGTGKAEILAGTGVGIYLHNNKNIRVTAFKVTGSGVSNGGIFNDGVQLLYDKISTAVLTSIYIDQVEVNGFRQAGIAFYTSGTNGGYDDLRVTNCQVHDNGLAGMWMGGGRLGSLYGFTNVYAGYDSFYDNAGVSGYTGQSGNGMFFKQVDGGTIEHCLAFNNGALNVRFNGLVGLWAIYSNNIVIQYNESYSNHSQAGDGNGLDLDGGVTNSFVQYNYTHGNDGPGILIYQFNDTSDAPRNGNNTIRYNVSERDNRKGGNRGSIWVGSSGSSSMQSNNRIYGNSIYTDNLNLIDINTACLRVSGAQVTNAQIYNNIFRADDGIPCVVKAGSGTASFKGNDYYSPSDFKITEGVTTYTSLSAWRVARGRETHNGNPVGLQVAPKFKNAGGGGTIGDTDQLGTLTAYKLPAHSRMIDAGLNLSALFGVDADQDFYGNMIPQSASWDIGAHEIP